MTTFFLIKLLTLILVIKSLTCKLKNYKTDY